MNHTGREIEICIARAGLEPNIVKQWGQDESAEENNTGEKEHSSI